MRHYYEVLVASRQYHSQKALTYHSDEQLMAGAIVSLELQNQPVIGIVSNEVSEPGFTTKALNASGLPPLPGQSLELINWFKNYYPAPFGSIIQLFLPISLLNNSEPSQPKKFSKSQVSLYNPPALTAEQQKVLESIKKPETYLLHGNTGSGKTRIYQELATKALQNGHSAIVLTPEISLTSQLGARFKEIFGHQVVIWHSQLTVKDRHEIWLKILTADQPLVVIGARSALFSPLRNIGLIIIDEAHESAYKQEQAPYYHAIRVAAKLASLYQAILVLGSATPSLVDYYIAQQKKTPILNMQALAVSGQRPDVKIEVVDIKDRNLFSHKQYLSDPMLKAMELALQKKEQILIFMNRRGTARVVICSNCGWQAMCPNCDTPLTYHGDDHIMRCHTCSYKTQALSSCPVCHSSDILYKIAGTKALIAELSSYFPKARLRRFDSDNKRSERFELNYESILKGDVDILVGTQMLAKGLDLPRLSLVGVVNADTSLSIPDYTAEEKTYQLISQVIGRVGRGHVSGKAVIQSYLPDSPLLKAAVKQDWQKFYELEIQERQKFKFPPFCHLLKLTCRRASSASAVKGAEQLAKTITDDKFSIQVSGPAPAFHERQSKSFEWQLIVKANRRSELLKIIEALPSGWSYDIDPVNLL